MQGPKSEACWRYGTRDAIEMPAVCSLLKLVQGPKWAHGVGSGRGVRCWTCCGCCCSCPPPTSPSRPPQASARPPHPTPLAPSISISPLSPSSSLPPSLPLPLSFLLQSPLRNRAVSRCVAASAHRGPLPPLSQRRPTPVLPQSRLGASLPQSDSSLPPWSPPQLLMQCTDPRVREFEAALVTKSTRV